MAYIATTPNNASVKLTRTVDAGNAAASNLAIGIKEEGQAIPTAGLIWWPRK